jgi:hypothetical protein
MTFAAAAGPPKPSAAPEATVVRPEPTVVPETALIPEPPSFAKTEAVAKLSVAAKIPTSEEIPVTAKTYRPAIKTPVVAPPIPRMRIVKVVPGTGADEYAAHKPIRPPISIRRACIGIIRVVPISTNRWRVINSVRRADLNADCNLSVRINCRNGQNDQQGKIFQVSHVNPPLSRPPTLRCFADPESAALKSVTDAL